MAEMEAILREGLAEGAVAVGFGSAYTPGASMAEIERMFRVAADGGASAHIHMRGGLDGPAGDNRGRRGGQGAAAHRARELVRGFGDRRVPRRHQGRARRGQDVTTEAYPYGAGMTEIQSALFDDWKTWPDERFALHQLVSTGERLTRATFEKARAAGGTVIIHGRTEEQTRAAIVSPLAMIASDGFIENGRGHPRTSGTYAKVLGKYVREEKVRPADGRAAAHDARAGAAPRAADAGDGDEGPHQGRGRRRPDDLRPGDRHRPRDVRGRDHSVAGHSVRHCRWRRRRRRRWRDGSSTGTCDPRANFREDQLNRCAFLVQACRADRDIILPSA